MAKQRQSKTANAVLVDELNKVDEVLEVGSNGLIACNDDIDMSATVDENLGVLTYELNEDGTQVDEDGNELIFSVNPDGSETYYNGHTEVEIYGQTSDRDKIVVTDNSVLNSYDFGVLGSMEQLINCSERDIRQSFVHIGCALSTINCKCLYKGYADVYEYAFNVFNYSKSSVKNLINIYDKFVDKTRLEVFPRFQEYSYSQLVEMSSLYNSEFELISSNFTVKQIREVKKFLKENGYSSSWNSSNIFDYIAKANAAYNNALLDKPKADKVVSEVSCSTGVADGPCLPSEAPSDVLKKRFVGEISISEQNEKHGVVDLSTIDVFKHLFNDCKFIENVFEIGYTFTGGRKINFSLCLVIREVSISLSVDYRDRLTSKRLKYKLSFDCDKNNDSVDDIYERYKYYYEQNIRMVAEWADENSI